MTLALKRTEGGLTYDDGKAAAAFISDFSAKLTAELGGNPNLLQKTMIAHAAHLHAWCTALENSLGAHPTQRDLRLYLRYNNTLTRSLAALNRKPRVKRQIEQPK